MPSFATACKALQDDVLQTETDLQRVLDDKHMDQSKRNKHGVEFHAKVDRYKRDIFNLEREAVTEDHRTYITAIKADVVRVAETLLIELFNINPKKLQDERDAEQKYDDEIKATFWDWYKFRWAANEADRTTEDSIDLNTHAAQKADILGINFEYTIDKSVRVTKKD